MHRPPQLPQRSARHARPLPRRLAAACAAGAASILFPLLAASAPGEAIDSATTEPLAYAASYTVKVFGLRGELTVEQHPAPDEEVPAGAVNDVWRFRSRIRAKGIAKLFVRGDSVEEALFEVAGERLRPLAVTVDDSISDKHRDVRFEWAASDGAADTGNATGEVGGEAFSLEVPPDTLDLSVVMPAIALELIAANGATDEAGRPLLATPYDGERGYRLRVLENGTLQDYFARLLGEERLDGPDGPLDTLVFEHQREGSTRATTFWLAPSMRYLAVQIQQRKDDKKPHLRAQLKEYRTVDSTAPRTASSE